MAKRVRQFKKDVDKVPKLYQHKPKRSLRIVYFRRRGANDNIFEKLRPSMIEIEQAICNSMSIVYGQLGRQSMALYDKKLYKKFMAGDFDDSLLNVRQYGMWF